MYTCMRELDVLYVDRKPRQLLLRLRGDQKWTLS